MRSSDNNLSTTTAGQSLSVVVRAEAHGPVLAREPVTRADLSDVFSEAWRDACLRKGHPDVPLSALLIRLVPTLADDSDSRCSGFALEVTLPTGKTGRREFSNRSLRAVASRAIQKLKEAGRLQDEPTILYEVMLDRKPLVPSFTESESFEIAIKNPALTYLTVPLRPLLKRAAAVNMLDDEVFPVFYTEEAVTRAERCARKGSSANPPVETGAVLVGPLCACPDTGEFFCVVSDVLEVMEAEESAFALSYTNRSWNRIQRVMKAKQAACPERAEHMLGQCHGHNFVPNDGKICDLCLKRPTCNMTNVFVSPDDQTWTRAVFARQPWQLCHIFGLSARCDRINGLYGLQDGRLQARGYFMLPDFQPEQWEQKIKNRKEPYAQE